MLIGSERAFLIEGCKAGTRGDGRGCSERRLTIIRTDVILSAIGSSRVQLGGTDVLVGIKFDVGAPDLSRPNSGRLSFSVECSPCAGPALQGRPGEALSSSLLAVLQRTFDPRFGNGLDLSKLSIVPAKKCLVLQVDLVILSVDGSLHDAASIAIKAALGSAQVPQVTVAEAEEGEEPELQLDDDPEQSFHIDTDGCPLLVTVGKVGSKCLLDLSATEEACSDASITAAVDGISSFVALAKEGDAGISPDSLLEMIRTVLQSGPSVQSEIAALIKTCNE